MDLLTHEEKYRSEKLMARLAEEHITICGCGAIGSNLIDHLTRQGMKNLTVIDKDRIEDHNRGTQIWDKRECGQLKTERMKARTYISTGITLLSVPKELTDENITKLMNSTHIIIDTFDNTKSRALLYQFCKCNKTECLHIGLYQDYAEVIWNDSYTVPSESKGLDVCEYPLARNIVLLSVAVASEVLIKFIDTGIKKNYTITLKDLKIQELDNGI